MDAPRLLAWADEEPGHGVVHVARRRLPRGAGFIPHHHDFCEAMWIEAGELDHRRDGKDERLAAGDLLCLRPEAIHQGTASGSHGCTLVNVSFHPDAVRGLAVRCGTRWPWEPVHAGRIHRLGPAARTRLHGWVAELAAPGQRQLDLDCFLLDLARLLADDGPDDHAAGLPGWLRDALPAFSEPRRLRGGVPALAELTGRGQAHLNRTVRAAQGRRATDLVNAIRLAWAAAQLRLTELEVGAVAEACGLAHLGHFYRLFEETFGTTPARYRKAARGAVPPPGVPAAGRRGARRSDPAADDAGYSGSFIPAGAQRR
jgi:AraC family cel operon transcriptional repressor